MHQVVDVAGGPCAAGKFRIVLAGALELGGFFDSFLRYPTLFADNDAVDVFSAIVTEVTNGAGKRRSVRIKESHSDSFRVKQYDLNLTLFL